MPRALDTAAIRQAAVILHEGGLVAFPTETVYGLGASADDPVAVQRIFAAKGRPPSHPLIVHVLGAAALPAWAREVPPAAHRLVEAFWPGPLTLVLPRSARARDIVTGGQDSVGLRSPSGAWARALIGELAALRADPAAAVAAPSANRYGRISPTRAEHVRADLGEKPGGLVDCILDGGDCDLGIESTIVDFPAGAVRLLRPGSVRAEQIAAVLGLPVLAVAGDADGPRASGRVAGHYAPAKPLELLAPDRLAGRMAALAPLRLGVLAPAGLLPDPPAVSQIEAPATAERYAHDLYDNLRRLDGGPAQRLLVVLPPAGPAWTAVHDRLQRAAAGSAAALSEAD